LVILGGAEQEYLLRVLEAAVQMRDRGPFDPMAGEGIGHEAARLHPLDEAVQEGGGFLATAFRRAHRLLDDHEASVQQAQACEAPRVGFELLLDAGRDFRAQFQEGVDHGRGGGRTFDLRMLQGAGQIQVVGAALADNDPVGRLVDFFVGANG
jgi:hypothetical protein